MMLLLVFIVWSKGLTPIQSLDFVDKVVGYCLLVGRKLESLTVEELIQGWPTHFGDDVNDHINVKNSVKLFCSEGSIGPYSVDMQLSYWVRKLCMPNPI